jgi:hypothetical protein
VRRTWQRLLALATIAVASGGCGGTSAPAARAFQSQQVLPIRDTTIGVVGVFQGLVFYHVTDPSSGATTFWSVSMADGQTENLGPKLPDGVLGTPPPLPDLVCSWTIMRSTDYVLTIADTRTGAQTVIDGVVSLHGGCPTPADPSLTLWRRGADGHVALWSGSYDNLTPAAPVDILVDEVIDLGSTTSHVVASSAAQPGSDGIFTVDVGTSQSTAVVPAALGAADWAPGATPDGALASNGLAAVGMRPAVTQQATRFFYARAMSDGGNVMFAGPGPFTVSAAGELALFRITGTTTTVPVSVTGLLGGSSAPAGPVASSLTFRTSGSAGDRLLIWNDDQERLVPCAFPLTATVSGLTSSDGQRIAYFPDNASLDSSLLKTGPLVLASLETAGGAGAPSCELLADADVASAAFSPDGRSLFWLAAPPSADREIWYLGPDAGQAPREIGAGAISDPRFADDTTLELDLGENLVTVDVRDDPPRVRTLAEQTFGEPIALTSPWVVVGAEMSMQDATGTLELVDREAQAAQIVSRAVAWYGADKTAPSSPPWSIAYLVRGRNPSPQDGFWVATISAGDLR